MEASATVDDPVALTERRLASRRKRAASHRRESAALLALADEMAQRPDNVLNLLCELTLDICAAESAGVSLLDERNDRFVWRAVAGAWAPFVNGSMPRSASPCGKVIEHDRALIYRDVVAQFPATAQAQPEIEEILLAPFHHGGVPVGTVWAISHDPNREFDEEDRRVLTNLARFAAAAHEMDDACQSARTAQRLLTLANRELGHRLKNLLTMVMAITNQTLKDHGDQAQAQVLQQRLAALGAAHNVLIEGETSAASIGGVAQNVLDRIGQADRVIIEGPDITLGSRTALGCALVLHELATNALKYGALSNARGQVRLSWAVEVKADGPSLVVRWKESGGPAATRPAAAGFGTTLINMGLLGTGGTRIDYRAEGVEVELSAPYGDASTL